MVDVTSDQGKARERYDIRLGWGSGTIARSFQSRSASYIGYGLVCLLKFPIIIDPHKSKAVFPTHRLVCSPTRPMHNRKDTLVENVHHYEKPGSTNEEEASSSS